MEQKDKTVKQYWILGIDYLHAKMSVFKLYHPYATVDVGRLVWMSIKRTKKYQPVYLAYKLEQAALITLCTV